MLFKVVVVVVIFAVGVLVVLVVSVVVILDASRGSMYSLSVFMISLIQS